ncbi:MAG: flagellar export chaperone FliS, partial [Planctomycetota bacterium]
TTLSQRDLLVKLYQGAERFINTAMAAMVNGGVEDAHINCQKAKRIFIELLSTLNMEVGGEVATQLQALYTFLIDEIAQANLAKDRERLAKLLPVVATLREAWQGIPDDMANVSSLNSGADHTFSVRT